MQPNYVLPFPMQSTRNVAPTWGVGNRGNNPSLKVFSLRQICCNGEHKLYVGMGEAGSVTSAMHLEIHLSCLYLLS